MAEEQFYTILTNIGKAKIANATLLNSNLTLKTLKVGDGNGTYYNPTEDQEDLKNTVHECAIGAIYIDKKNPNWIISETIIPGSVGGFTIREVGLFDAEGDMIAVGKYPETYKPVVANGASKDLNVRTIFEVSNAENVTLNLDPSVIIATKEDVNNLQEQIEENTTQLKDLANSRFINIFSITKNITGKNIKIIGDSITSGVRGTGFAMDGEQFYGEFKENTSGHCWANSLKTYLQTNFNCTVHNYGVGGLNSTDLANNISTFVKNTDDIVLCMVGTNDRQLTNPTTIIQNNIKTIYNYVKNLGKEIIFLSALPALENVETYNCKMKDIDNAIMNVTSSLNLEYISAYKLVVDYLESRDMKLADILSDDYVHPNDNGYDIMFYLILNKLGFSKINSLDYIHDTGWMDIPLSSGITVLDGYAYQYRRIGKQVFLRAPLVGVAQAQQVVGTLPVGFRPNSIHYYASFKNGYQPIACCVNTDGTIVIMGSTDGQYVTGHFYCINTNFAIG